MCVFISCVFFFISWYTVFFPSFLPATRREATILDERIQKFPFLSFIGHGSKGGPDMKKHVGPCIGGSWRRYLLSFLDGVEVIGGTLLRWPLLFLFCS